MSSFKYVLNKWELTLPVSLVCAQEGSAGDLWLQSWCHYPPGYLGVTLGSSFSSPGLIQA